QLRALGRCVASEPRGAGAGTRRASRGTRRQDRRDAPQECACADVSHAPSARAHLGWVQRSRQRRWPRALRSRHGRLEDRVKGQGGSLDSRLRAPDAGAHRLRAHARGLENRMGPDPVRGLPRDPDDAAVHVAGLRLGPGGTARARPDPPRPPSGAALTSSAATLLLASACAYAGGMALNDACDATLDARERPERPIPSGRITRAGAFTVAGLLLALCLGLAAASGLRPFLVALGLVVAIVVYDAVAKRTAVGPAVMASCRALNAGLGIALGALAWPAVGAVAILFAYVLILTLVSRFEVMTAPVTLVRAAASGFAALLAIAVALFVLGWGPGGLTGLVFLALLAAWLGPPVRDAIADPAPRRIIGVIKAAVLGIILLDAAFTSASRGLVSGAPVAACFVLAHVLGRRFASSWRRGRGSRAPAGVSRAHAGDREGPRRGRRVAVERRPTARHSA